MTQISPSASLAQRNPPGLDASAAAQTTQQPAVQAQQPAQQTQQPEESAAVKAKIAAIYAEAEADHWSEAQTNQAVTKELEQSGASSSSAATTLIDTTA